MKLTVTARRPLTSEIEEFTLSPIEGEELPTAGPGDHVTIETPSGANRRYSLVHPGKSPKSYVVSIKREPESRGGSESMHKLATVGTTLQVDEPENEFLLGSDHPVLLIAGGIGITPIYSMAQQLAEEKRDFRVVYCTRELSKTAYADEMRELCGERLTLDHSNDFDFWDLLEKPTSEHIYCCGPSPLMEEIKAVSGHWSEGRVHFEDFKPVDVVRDNDKPFTVVLAKTGTEIEVPRDLTILEALRDKGHKVSSSCESGTCGTCKCSYLEGEVEHRDQALMDDEKGEKIMICVSRAIGDRLVLDL